MLFIRRRKGVLPLKTKVNEEKKIVEIWLTNAEQKDEELRESLKTLYEKYKQEKYKVAVFLSGSRDLFKQTEALLLHNQTVLARHDLEREQSQGMTMSM